MRIIYIAGAVRGTEDAGTRFFGAEEQLTEKGYSVFNPLDLPYLADLPEEKIMDICKAYVRAADDLYLIPGKGKSSWSWSKGANEELREFVATHKDGRVFANMEDVPEV